MSTRYYNLSDYDVVFLSYDEPNADTNWKNIKKLIPKAKRVHGVKGSDTAHKECARVATTDRLIIIDGDNWLWGDLLNQTLVLSSKHDEKSIVFSWPSRNVINGLLYGNGGIKCWNRQTIFDMRTHENAPPGDQLTQVDFCWLLNYIPLDTHYSTIVNNASKQQAWRAGFREGVKMSLDRGGKVDKLSTLEKSNLNRLKIWMTTGLDAVNGIWAILGARQGCHLTALAGWDHTQVRDFDYLNDYYSTNISTLTVDAAFDAIGELGKSIGEHIDLPDPFSESHSRFVKSLDYNPKRQPSYIKTQKNHAYDIVMITYDEPEGDSNYNKLRNRFPCAKRIHGVKGIHQAHIEASKICTTDMFWVVDGDADIDEQFDFSFNLEKPDDVVRVWRSINPVNDLIYGYGGVKLLPRIKTMNMDLSKPDMTTSISEKYEPIFSVSNKTCFNTDPFNTWKAAFRECCKLASKVIDRQKEDDTNHRLNIWCTKGSSRPFGQYAIAGAISGKEYGYNNRGDIAALKKINDFEWLKEQYEQQRFS